MHSHQPPTRVPGRNLFTTCSLSLGICLLAAQGFAQTPPEDRRATRILLEDIPLISDAPIACEGHFLDGVLVDATITVRGLEHNAGLNTPWQDNGGGEHIVQIAPQLTFNVVDSSGAYHWQGWGKGRYLYQGGGGSGQHLGGVVMLVQDEYYQAEGAYPDLWWSIDLMLVVDANGNVRQDRLEVPDAPFVCVQ